jgi:hypothetical protein
MINLKEITNKLSLKLYLPRMEQGIQIALTLPPRKIGLNIKSYGFWMIPVQPEHILQKVLLF